MVKDVLYRAGRTFLVTYASFFLVAAPVATIDHLAAFSTACLAAILSILTSLVGLPEYDANTRNKVLAVSVRALKTAAQTALAAIPTSAVLLEQIDWNHVLQFSLTAAIGSLLLGIVSVLPETDEQIRVETPRHRA